MKDYITGKLVRAGSFAWSDNPANDAMAYALVATERDTLRRVKSLPMYEEVAIIRNETHRIQTERIAELERENAALREDKARLDWLAEELMDTIVHNADPTDFVTEVGGWPLAWRDAIDAARKESQP